MNLDLFYPVEEETFCAGCGCNMDETEEEHIRIESIWFEEEVIHDDLDCMESFIQKKKIQHQ